MTSMQVGKPPAPKRVTLSNYQGVFDVLGESAIYYWLQKGCETPISALKENCRPVEDWKDVSAEITIGYFNSHPKFGGGPSGIYHGNQILAELKCDGNYRLKINRRKVGDPEMDPGKQIFITVEKKQ